MHLRVLCRTIVKWVRRGSKWSRFFKIRPAEDRVASQRHAKPADALLPPVQLGRNRHTLVRVR